jgi:putative hydrolase of the HAD superfamily
MSRAVLFDLDETLVVEEASVVAAFEATARLAAERRDVHVGALAVAARLHARELWRAAPTYPYCLAIGISSWEGLWCRFDGNGPEMTALRAWAPTYRSEAWARALGSQGVYDPDLADELGERFGGERRARHEVFADAEPSLAALRPTYMLALVTNGASCLQREKLDASQLDRYFDAVVVSAEFGIGKPEPEIFEYTLAELGVSAAEATMVGDSLTRDVAGAVQAGMSGVWLNRFGQDATEAVRAVELATLDGLSEVLNQL